MLLLPFIAFYCCEGRRENRDFNRKHVDEKKLFLWASQLSQRLPKGAVLDPDTYRKEKLYKEGLEKIVTRRIEGFRALFQVAFLAALIHPGR